MRYSSLHVDLRQLALLAARLDRLGRRLGARAERLRAPGAELGLDPAPRRRLLEVAAWADDRHRMVRAVVADIARLEQLGALPPSTSVTRRRHAAFADPVVAHRAAREVIALLGVGATADQRRAGELMREHRGDPVFAATLLHGVGASGVAAVLHRADRRWAQGLAVDRALVDGLAAALAVAMRVGVSPFGWRTLAEHSDGFATGPRALGLLFLAPAAFSTPALVGALRHLVVPWNQAVAADVGAGSSPWGIAGPRGAIDVRAVVLRRVAEDPAAARTVVATTDLDRLLPADLGYGDGGLALTEVLVAGTAPIDGSTGEPITDPMITGQRPAQAVSAANLRKVVGWIGAHRRVPIGVEMGIDRLLRPWIGSVRSAGLDEPVTRHVDLDEGAARRVIAAGMRFDGGRRRLGEAAWAWAAREARRLASDEVAGVGFDAIGSVVGIVAIEAQNALAVRAVRQDLERHRQRTLWTQVQGLALKPIPGVARLVVGAVGPPIRDKVLPDTAHELSHWREHRDLDVGHDGLALEYLVMAALWDQREANRYFEIPGGRPSEALTVTGRGRVGLRPLVELDEKGVADYLSWRSRLADGRAAPVQLAAERFLAEGREATAP